MCCRVSGKEDTEVSGEVSGERVGHEKFLFVPEGRSITADDSWLKRSVSENGRKHERERMEALYVTTATRPNLPLDPQPLRTRILFVLGFPQETRVDGNRILGGRVG